MIIHDLTAEEAAAVARGLESHGALVERSGKDPSYLQDMDGALLGYRGFAERLAADAVYRLDYVLHPKLDALRDGQELRLDGVTFSHVSRRDGRLSATAVDADGVQRFRIHWNPDDRPKRADPEGLEFFHVDLQSCPAEDPQYEYAERIGGAHLSRNVADRVESRTSGSLWAHDFFDFMDAMDLLRPALSAEILAMPRPRPMSDKVPYSHAEIDRIMVSEAVRLDGGLPGRLARHVVSVMLEGRGTTILRSLARRSARLAEYLVGEGCIWRGAALTTMDRDNVFYAVPSHDGSRTALFVNARNSSGPYTAFLAWTDPSNGTAFIAAAKGGRDLFRVVDAFVAGDVPDAPTAAIKLKSGKHDLGQEVVGTSIIDLALHHVRFLEEDLKEVADGERAYEDTFEKVEDFDFFIEANEDFYLDDEEVPPAAADL